VRLEAKVVMFGTPLLLDEVGDEGDDGELDVAVVLVVGRISSVPMPPALPNHEVRRSSRAKVLPGSIETVV